MPVTKVQFRPGINKEITLYANEGGWYNCDKIRWRSGYPEKLGGWTNYASNASFRGVPRTLFNWVSYSSENLLAVGTSQKFYVENGRQYFDITPIRSTASLNNPFTVPTGSNLVLVNSPSHGAIVGAYVYFISSSNMGNLDYNFEFEIVSVVDSNNYYILALGTDGNPAVFNGVGPNTGGGTVTAVYRILLGPTVDTTGVGWGIVPWGSGGWGTSSPTNIPMQLWSMTNFNQDLVFASRQGTMYYWTKDTVAYSPSVTINQQANNTVKTTVLVSDAGGVTFTGGSATINVPLDKMTFLDIGNVMSGTNIVPGSYVTGFLTATSVSINQNTLGNNDSNPYTFSYAGLTSPNETLQVVSSSTYGFIIALGSTPYDPSNFNSTFDPMLVRWSDQSNAVEWTPTTYNQSGEQRLTNGSYIVGSVNTRQEILIWTDASLYSMQYLGPPYTWGFTSLMDNISTISPNCMVSVNGITYWMGVDKFFIYSGRVDTLPCSLRKFVFTNINLTQGFQIVSGYNEAFNEVWWHYPSVNSQINDSYVIFNYAENTWYYGSLNRTAWLDSPLRQYPMAGFGVQTSYLNSAIGAADTSFVALNGGSYPLTGTVILGNEQITYSGVTGNTFTGCVRGVNGTTAASHLAYTVVTYIVPNQIIFHEVGVDDMTGPVTLPISSYAESSDFDIGDGDRFAFVWRMLPDFAFKGSTAVSPKILLTVKPRQNAGAAYQSSPAVDKPSITGSTTYPVEQFTGEVYTRVRGRAMALRIDSVDLGVAWQLGALRIDVRPDGRKS